MAYNVSVFWQLRIVGGSSVDTGSSYADKLKEVLEPEA
jgi:hypothetical protein